MGEIDAKRKEPADTVKREIPPYRMAQIMKTAADIADRLVNGKFLYSPTYRECEIILDLVGKAVMESKEENDVFK